MLSIGGNDIGFAKLIKGCLGGRECYLAGAPSRVLFEEKIAELPDLFEGLHTKLVEALGHALVPHRVYLTGYPDPTKDEDGNYCTASGGLTIRQSAYQWASTTILGQLTSVMRAAAAKYGWQFVAPSDDFDTHGYCARDAWFTSLSGSLLAQFDMLGAFHPNAEGHRSLGASLFAALRTDLLPGDQS